MVLVNESVEFTSETSVCLLDHTLLEVVSMAWFHCTVCFEKLSNKIDISFRKRIKEDTFGTYLDLTLKP